MKGLLRLVCFPVALLMLIMPSSIASADTIFGEKTFNPHDVTFAIGDANTSFDAQVYYQPLRLRQNLRTP